MNWREGKRIQAPSSKHQTPLARARRAAVCFRHLKSAVENHHYLVEYSRDNESSHTQRPKQGGREVPRLDQRLFAAIQRSPETNPARPVENETCPDLIPPHHERHLGSSPPCGNNSLSCFAAHCSWHVTWGSCARKSRNSVKRWRTYNGRSTISLTTSNI